MTTKHTCGGPVFGRLTAGCPACDMLRPDAPRVVPNEPVTERQERDAQAYATWAEKQFGTPEYAAVRSRRAYFEQPPSKRDKVLARAITILEAKGKASGG